MKNQNKQDKKYQLASEIMKVMIKRYSQKGIDGTNITLATLLDVQNEMYKFNWKVIDQIIEKYGPMADIQPNKKLQKVNLENNGTQIKQSMDARDASEILDALELRR